MGTGHLIRRFLVHTVKLVEVCVFRMVFRWSLVHIRDLVSNECHPVVIFYLRTWQYFTFILPPFCSLPFLVNSLNLISLFPAKISSTPLWLGSLKSVNIPSQTTWSIEVWLVNREYNDEQKFHFNRHCKCLRNIYCNKQGFPFACILSCFTKKFQANLHSLYTHKLYSHSTYICLPALYEFTASLLS